MTDTERTTRFLEQQKYMTIAVVLDDGTPWATPVRVQAHGEGYFEWDSRTDTMHSQAIVRNPTIAISMFEVRPDGHFGYYARATAAVIHAIDTDRSRYRATVDQVWINDESFVKRELSHDS